MENIDLVTLIPVAVVALVALIIFIAFIKRIFVNVDAREIAIDISARRCLPDVLSLLKVKSAFRLTF